MLFYPISFFLSEKWPLGNCQRSCFLEMKLLADENKDIGRVTKEELADKKILTLKTCRKKEKK